jgi:hypothetical protein
MSGGFSRAIAPRPFTIQKYLDGTSPLFIPSGGLISSTVEIVPGGSILHAFYLPSTLSHMPVGMFWKPTDALDVTLMINSIKALSSSKQSPYASFIQVLEALEQKLCDCWVNAMLPFIPASS